MAKYNQKYGDDRVCECGHPYYRHFDTYDNMNPVGCKYCQCYVFKEPCLAKAKVCTIHKSSAGLGKKPWEFPKDRVSVIQSYEAEVVGEDGGDYVITVAVDGIHAEGRMAKTEFKSFPHAVRVGTCFGLVFFQERGGRFETSAWPLARHWHPSLRTQD